MEEMWKAGCGEMVLSSLQALSKHTISPNLHTFSYLEAPQAGPFGVLWRFYYISMVD